MTKTNMDLTELLQKHDQGDLLRSIAEAVLQLMTEAFEGGGWRAPYWWQAQISHSTE